jgi:hypothetical protein
VPARLAARSGRSRSAASRRRRSCTRRVTVTFDSDERGLDDGDARSDDSAVDGQENCTPAHSGHDVSKHAKGSDCAASGSTAKQPRRRGNVPAPAQAPAATDAKQQKQQRGKSMAELDLEHDALLRAMERAGTPERRARARCQASVESIKLAARLL